MDVMFFGVAGKTFLTVPVSADADDDKSLILVFFEKLIVVGNGSHARATPGGIKIHDDNFSLDVVGGDAAIDPIADMKGWHLFAFEGRMIGAVFRLVIPSPTFGKFARASDQSAESD